MLDWKALWKLLLNHPMTLNNFYFQIFWYITGKKFPEIVITEVSLVGGKNSILIKLGKHISQNQVNYEEFFLLNEFVMGNAIWYFFVRNKMTCFPLPPSHLGAC